MTETTVAYHVEDGVGRPAIDVKDHHAGLDYIMVASRLMPEASFDGTAAYERIVSDFWQAAEEIATQRGLGEITQEGRSGGWLVFTDGRDPQDPESCCEDLEHADGIECPDAVECVRDWLAGYRSMVEWADAWIADAPRKVAALAQQYAMDEASEPAARRMFAFGKGVTA